MKRKSKQQKENLLKLLKTSNISKRLKLLDRLNGTKERDSIKILLRILEDTSWTLREKAAHKLANFGNRVVPYLTKLCDKGYWFTRASACLSLGEIGDLRALDSIMNLLLIDDNPTVIKEASLALAKIAQQNPVEFSKIIKTMALDNPKILRILVILETTDIEVYSKIKQAMEMDSTDLRQ